MRGAAAAAWPACGAAAARAAAPANHGLPHRPPCSCLVPDLYKGKVGVDKEEASHLLSKLDWPAAVDEIKQAVQYLRADGAQKVRRPAGAAACSATAAAFTRCRQGDSAARGRLPPAPTPPPPPQVGCIGFCMGGALTLCAAQHAGVDAAAPFYGIPGAEICQPENIKVPLAMHHGALDAMKGFSDPEVGAGPGVVARPVRVCLPWTARPTVTRTHPRLPLTLPPPPQSAHAFAAKVNAAGGSAQVYVYEGCGHGFLNVGEEAVAKRAHMGFPEPPREAQELAWSRVLQLFEEHLKQ